MKIIEWLKLSEVKNINNLDDPSVALLHAEIIRKKPFLKKLYVDFYNRLKESISGKDKLLVELGSGGGFIKDIIPGVITSDILKLPGVDKCFSAMDMPFGNNTVDMFFMIDVFHHIKDTRRFFNELDRCLKVGGKAVMIEPANTLWSRFIYRNFHHEPFNPSEGWGLKENGPLSSANGALPWIVFCRDRLQFENEFPFKIVKLAPHTPFRYLISGGVSIRQLLPSFAYSMVKGVEKLLSPFNRFLGMFLTVEIEKYDVSKR